MLYFTYGTSSGTFLSALNTNTHTVQWTQPIVTMGVGNPVVANNTVYYYTGANYTQTLHQDATLYAFRADTGTRLWSVTPSPGYNTRGTPLLYSNGVVYVGSDKLYAVNGVSGQTLWNSPVRSTGQTLYPPVVDGSMLYVLGTYQGQGGVTKVVPTTGQILWSTQSWPMNAIASDQTSLSSIS